MSTNPGNAVGTNGAFGGRTSVNAFNDVLGMFSGRGVLQGWELAPSSGMTITVGGDGTTRDVAVAEDNIGNRTTIDNISGQPIEVEIPAAPASNSRIDLIVAYVDNPAQGSATVTDNYEACGLIVVSGTAAASPTAPDESDIRTAITTDGGAGTVAYYVVLGQVTVASGTTDIDSTMLTNGSHTGVTSDNVDWQKFTISSNNQNFAITQQSCASYGSLVVVSFQATIINSSVSNVTITPSINLKFSGGGFQPVIIARANNNATMYPVRGWLGSNGLLNINSYTTMTVGTSVDGMMVFVNGR